MKEKDAQVDFPQQRMVLYVEKEDGSYGATVTGSYLSKNYLDDYLEKRERWEKRYLEKVMENEISPIAYYLVVREMSPGDLAARSAVPLRQVKRHMDPRHFGSMTLEVARRYAEVFDVPVAGLFESVCQPGAGSIVREKTKNSYFVKIRFAEKESR